MNRRLSTPKTKTLMQPIRYRSLPALWSPTIPKNEVKGFLTMPSIGTSRRRSRMF